MLALVGLGAALAVYPILRRLTQRLETLQRQVAVRFRHRLYRDHPSIERESRAAPDRRDQGAQESGD